MKKSIFTVVVTISTFACGLCSCSSIGTISRGNKYNNLYKERPVKIAILPVNNQTGDKDCISYFENTSDSVIIKKGYDDEGNLIEDEFVIDPIAPLYAVSTKLYKIIPP